MKKNLLLLFVALFSFANYASAQFVMTPNINIAGSSKAVAADEIAWRYCGPDSELIGAVGVNQSATLSAAIQLTSEQFGVFEGEIIKGVRVGLSANVTNLKVFIRNSLTGNDIYSETVGSATKGWKDVTFTTPFTVPDGEFYVGYTCTGLNQIGFSGDSYAEGGWLWYNGWANYSANGWGSVCIQLIIDISDFDKSDFGITKVNNTYSMMGEPFETKGVVRNNSLNTIESLIVEYTVDGGSPIEKTATCNVAPGQLGAFTFEADGINAAAGIYALEVALKDADDYPLNDKSSGEVEIFKYTYPKRVVAEEATGTWCQWCPYGFVGMAQMHEKYPDSFIGIAVHNRDAMTVTAYDSALASYISGYPDCLVNRKTTGHPYAELEDLYLAEMAIPCQVGVELEASMNQDLTEVDIVTSLTFGYTSAEVNCKLVYVLIENDVTGYKQTNGFAGGGAGAFYGWENLPNQVEVVFDEVARGIYSGFSGIPNSVPASVEENVPVEHTYKITLPTTIQDKDQLELVVMLLNAKGEVLNAAKVYLEEGDVAIDNIAKENVDCYVYPKDNALHVNVNTAGNITVDLFDVNGRKIMTDAASSNGKGQVIIPVSVTKGVYLVKVTTDKGTTVKKVIL